MGTKNFLVRDDVLTLNFGRDICMCVNVTKWVLVILFSYFRGESFFFSVGF